MDLVERFTGFMGSCDTYEEADSVIVGIPMDFTVSFKPGSRFAPQAVRNVSYGIEEYSVYLDKVLSDYMFYDWGDINLPIGNVPGSLDRIGQVAAKLFGDNKFPIFIGGEHLVSYPIIREASKKYHDLIVIQFDAHADLREDYLGEENSHATVMRKAAQIIGGKNLYQFGIRSGTRDEFIYAKENTNMFVDKVIEPLKSAINEIGNKPVYITIDIDVVDGAFAPGTGTIEPGGISAREMIEAIHTLQNLNVVGMDIVEIAPALDQSERTALLGAKLIRESILSYTKNIAR